MSIESVRSAIRRAKAGSKTGVILMVDEIELMLRYIDSIQSLIAAAPDMLLALEVQERAHGLKGSGRECSTPEEAEKIYDTWKAAQVHADELRTAVLAKIHPDSSTHLLREHPGG